MKPLRIVHLFPDLLNLYGDGGNVRVLQRRCEWRGIAAEVVRVDDAAQADLTQADIVFMGGGPDREQRVASEHLLHMANLLRDYVEDDGVVLAICGGFQIMGRQWYLGDETIEGLGIIDLKTLRTDGPRLIDNIILDSPVAKRPVVGYENHAGRTYLGEGLQPFGTVVSPMGQGNNDTEKGIRADGVLYRNVIGTYLHGPLLGKNPEVADHLLHAALVRRGEDGILPPLDDDVELAASDYLLKRLMR